MADNEAANIQWTIAGGGSVAEGGAPNFTVAYTGATLEEIDVSIDLAFVFGSTEAADFTDDLLQNVADAIALLPLSDGISLSGSTLTFSNPAVTSLTFAVPTIEDAPFEGDE